MSKQTKKHFFETFPGKLVLGIFIKIIITVGTLIFTAVASLKIADLLHFTYLERNILLISVSIIVLGIGGWLIYKAFLKQKIPADFHVIEKKFIHEYLEPLKIKHVRYWKLKPLRNGLDCFRDKYAWSGTSVEFKATIEGHSVLTKGYSNLFTLYDYMFGRSLKKKALVDAEVEFYLGGEHKYFVSTPIEEQTDKLIMKVIFPPSWNINKVILVISPISGSKTLSEGEEVAITRGVYEWVVPSPLLKYHYEIRWTLNNIN